MARKRILIFNQLDLDLGGKPETGDYRVTSSELIESLCSSTSEQLNLELYFYHPKSQKRIFEWIKDKGENFDGFVLSPVAKAPAGDTKVEQYRSLLSMIANLGKPTIEVHSDNTFTHGIDSGTSEDTLKVQIGLIAGLGAVGYLLAIKSIASQLSSQEA